MSLRLDRLSPAVRAKAAPFLEDLARVAGADLHSLHVVGSAVTPDWVEGRSDVNTLLVLREMDLAVLEAIGPLGKRHRRTGIAPPLVMDTAYIAGSLDVFPMEFLELRLIHETVAGEDLLAGLEIGRADLRHQCEREVRSRLVGLRQAYLRSLGEPKALAEALARLPRRLPAAGARDPLAARARGPRPAGGGVRGARRGRRARTPGSSPRCSR